MKSAVYTGYVRHRRFGPVEHRFRYRLFMLYLDLAEVNRVFERRPLWSSRRPALARFRREDHYGSPNEPLDASIRRLVYERLGRTPEGPIRLLTHPRYFGYVMNPVSFYFCFATDDRELEAVVLEVTNTPWGERHMYVLDRRARTVDFSKALHVSPFMEMDYTYHCRVHGPGKRLAIHIENRRDGDKHFDATLTLRRRPLTSAALAGCLLRFPFMTAQVALAIYFEALRLKLKGARFFPHPNRISRPETKEAQ